MKIETKNHAEVEAVFARAKRGEFRIHGLAFGKVNKAEITFQVSAVDQPEMFKPQDFNLRRRTA